MELVTVISISRSGSHIKAPARMGRGQCHLYCKPHQSLFWVKLFCLFRGACWEGTQAHREGLGLMPLCLQGWGEWGGGGGAEAVQPQWMLEGQQLGAGPSVHDDCCCPGKRPCLQGEYEKWTPRWSPHLQSFHVLRPQGVSRLCSHVMPQGFCSPGTAYSKLWSLVHAAAHGPVWPTVATCVHWDPILLLGDGEGSCAFLRGGFWRVMGLQGVSTCTVGQAAWEHDRCLCLGQPPIQLSESPSAHSTQSSVPLLVPNTRSFLLK